MRQQRKKWKSSFTQFVLGKKFKAQYQFILSKMTYVSTTIHLYHASEVIDFINSSATTRLLGDSAD
jgi:hypothetical protein